MQGEGSAGITAGKTGRIEWLDVLRALAMYLVVIGHATEDSTSDSYKFYIYSFHMPLFFMISGAAYYLQMRSKSFHLKALVKNKAESLLWPYLTLSILTLGIWILNFKILSHSDSTIWDKLYGILYSNEEYMTAPSNALWFLTALFLTTILFYLVQKWSAGNEKNLILAVALLGLIGYACSLDRDAADLPWHIGTVPIALVMFMLGYLFLRHLDSVERFFGGTKRQICIFAVCLAVGYLCARNNIKISMSANNYGSFILFMGSSVCFSAALMLLSVWLPKFGILKFIGRNTIVYLAFHAPIFRFIEVFSNRTREIFENHPIIVATLVYIALIPVAYVFERYLGFLLGRKKKALKKNEGQA